MDSGMAITKGEPVMHPEARLTTSDEAEHVGEPNGNASVQRERKHTHVRDGRHDPKHGVLDESQEHMSALIHCISPRFKKS